MTTTPTPPTITDLLSLLRSVESAPADRDMAWSEHCTRQQAAILRLQSPAGRITDISDLTNVTGIPIDLVPNIPVAGTAFPTKDGWRIHLSAALNDAAQLRVALHELKHVLDHPLRMRPLADGLQGSDYEHLADYFADCVLAEAQS